MAKRIKFKIGDIFIVPLENNLKGAGRVLRIDKATVLIELYKIKPFIDSSEFNFEEAIKEKPLVIAWCYNDAIRKGEWPIIDNKLPEDDIDMPYFWHQDACDKKFYIRKGTKDSFRTFGERIEISKEQISEYDPEGIGTEISKRKIYIKRLREMGLM
jgi:hypothetical protein